MDNEIKCGDLVKCPCKGTAEIYRVQFKYTCESLRGQCVLKSINRPNDILTANLGDCELIQRG